MSRLWYKQPAAQWEEALPLGNGRLGAMVFGGVQSERIQLNEESIWYGGPVHRRNPDAVRYLPMIRKALLDGRIAAAEKMMVRGLSGCPVSMHPYQPLGDITLRFDGKGEVANYRRTLDLETAVARVEYTQNGVAYTREAFISAPDDCMVIRIRGDKPGSVSFDAVLTRSEINGFQQSGRYYDGVGKRSQREIFLHGNLGRGGYEFAMNLRAKAKGGSVRVIGETLCIEKADEVLLIFTADCTYHCTAGEKERYIKRAAVEPLEIDGEGLTAAEIQELKAQQGLQELLQARIKARLDAAENYSYDMLLVCHQEDYRSYFGRVSLSIHGDAADDAAAEALPTDERLQRLEKGGTDVPMAGLYFDFGRYLLISCSRPGTLAAPLQGLWNQDYAPAWDAKYTVNINTQMNYWPTEVCALSECHEPLFDLIENMRKSGRETAREMYGCRGFVCHHNTDIRGDTDVQDAWLPGSYWVMGAAWLCTHLWTHYEYTGDKNFLRRAFPVMSEAALFFLDFLIEVDGHLMTCPSTSPENTYILPNGEQGANGAGTTMDNQILRDLFTQCLDAAKELDTEEISGLLEEIDVWDARKFLSDIEDALSRLLPTRIGSDGRILEWREEYEEAEPGHRHISHLYGLHPSSQITPDGTPELAAAARKTLEHRLSFGGGHTGWSRAWIINHYAKLWDGEAAYENLCELFGRSTYPNLFDKHPPFQIDGNFGGTAAIASMLVQSSKDRVLLLPALPEKWKSGSARGLRIVGNAAVSLAWADGKLVRCTIKADSDFKAPVYYGDKCVPVALAAGEETVIFG